MVGLLRRLYCNIYCWIYWWISTGIWQRYGQVYSSLFFDSQCINLLDEILVVSLNTTQTNHRFTGKPILGVSEASLFHAIHAETPARFAALTHW